MIVGPYISPLIKGGMKTSYNSTKVMLESLGMRVVNPFLRSFDVAEVHSVDVLGQLIVKKAKRSDKKVIIRAHTTHKEMNMDLKGNKIEYVRSEKYANFVKKTFEKNHNSGDVLITPTKYSKRVLEKNFEIRVPIHSLSNGINLDEWEFSEEGRKEFRKKHGLKKPTVYCLAHLLPRKGLHDFVRVARKLPEYSFAWYGNRVGFVKSPPRKKCKPVKFLGGTDKPVFAHSSGDVFFFPTLQETEGIPVLEAMAIGNPCVVRDIPAFSRYKHGKDVLKARTVSEMVRNIRECVENDTLRKKLVSNGSKTVRKYSFENVKIHYKKVLDSL
jgi:1,2-diacylglycerol-3-alpha-glucose alpha-1,2-glucosyltransferase